MNDNTKTVRQKTPNTMRRRVFLVVAMIALAPILILALSVPYEAWVQHRLIEKLNAVDFGTEQVSNEQLGAQLKSEKVWGRVVGDQTTFTFEGPTPTNLVGFFSNTRDKFLAWDSAQPPLAQRVATADLNVIDCRVSEEGQFLICTKVVGVELDGHPTLVHLTAVNVRNVRALSPLGIIQLSFELLLIALLIGFWLVRRVSDPVESLHNQVVEADVSSADRKPIVVDDDTEIGALGSAFENLLRTLELRNERTEQFASDFAHELKNPLAAISSCSDNMRAGLVEPDHIEQYVGVLDRSSVKLQRLLNDFLALARAESGLKHAARVPINIRNVVERVVDDLTHDHNLAPDYFELDCETAVAQIPEAMFQTAIHNIIENAIQVGSPKVRIKLAEENDHVTLTIRDFGPGFGADDPNLVFERFYTRRDGGTGLGLAIAKAVVVAARGTIEAAQADRGTIFRVSLRRVTS